MVSCDAGVLFVLPSPVERLMPAIEIGSEHINLEVVTGRVADLERIPSEYDRTLHYHEFSITRDGKSDIRERVPGSCNQEDIPISNGQTVTCIRSFMDNGGPNDGKLVRFLNHDMQRFWTITSAGHAFPPPPAPPTPSGLRFGLGCAGLFAGLFASLFATPLLPVAIQALVWPVWLLWLVVFVVRLYRMRMDSGRDFNPRLLRKKNKFRFERFEAECDQLARSILAH
jgi:hypothetical protein